jgi:predicted DNA-binding antitoxin AbrB/MazE fold protein
MSTIPAVYEHGVFRPTVPVDLPEGTQMNISAPAIATVDPQGARQRFLDLIGSVDSERPFGMNNDDIDRDLVGEYFK